MMYAPSRAKEVQLTKPARAPSTVLFGDAEPAALLIVASLCFPNFFPIKYAPTSANDYFIFKVLYINEK